MCFIYIHSKYLVLDAETYIRAFVKGQLNKVSTDELSKINNVKGRYVRVPRYQIEQKTLIS